MRRRDILLGIGITLSGCINIGAENKYEPDLDLFDGYPPLPSQVPSKQPFDPATFAVAEVNSDTYIVAVWDFVADQCGNVAGAVPDNRAWVGQ